MKVIRFEKIELSKEDDICVSNYLTLLELIQREATDVDCLNDASDLFQKTCDFFEKWEEE